MARSQETFNKKTVRTKKEKKRKEKEQKRLVRRENAKDGKSFDDMIAYVDENGMLSSTPPEPGSRQKVKAEDIEISVPKRLEEETKDVVRKGVLTYFNTSRGFGFIKDLANQQEVFVHINDIDGTVSENSKVSFEIEMGHKGPKAVKVKADK